MFTKQQLAQWEELGFKFDDFYHTVAVEEKKVEPNEEEIDKNIGDSTKNKLANGHYFKIDGTFLGKEGFDNKIVLCSEKKEKISSKNEKYWVYTAPIHTDFKFDDMEEIAALVYAEGSIQFINDIKEIDFEYEAFALGTTIINYKLKRIHDEKIGVPYKSSYSQILTDMGALGKGKPLYNILKKTESLKRNNSNMQVCIAASINALCFEFIKSGKTEFNSKDKLNYFPFDRSNNAILWDGVDIKENYNDPHPKIKQGYLIIDNEHNVNNIESKKTTENSEGKIAKDGKVCLDLYSLKDTKFKETKCYEYTYKTTFGVAKTMFVKHTDQFEEAIVSSRREKIDGKFILNKWWK